MLCPRLTACPVLLPALLLQRALNIRTRIYGKVRDIVGSQWCVMCGAEIGCVGSRSTWRRPLPWSTSVLSNAGVASSRSVFLDACYPVSGSHEANGAPTRSGETSSSVGSALCSRYFTGLCSRYAISGTVERMAVLFAYALVMPCPVLT